jgi:L-ascorbate metabolism protein UlaG (beta-lactamase superfamily)
MATLLVITACARPSFYHGPKSDHFDGRRFFNPDGEQGTGGDENKSLAELLEGKVIERHQSWPASVPVTPSIPPRQVAGETMLVTWIGHSSVLVQTQGLNILIDPVWASRDSPVKGVGPLRVRAPGVRFRDLPHIDLVLISHDHYDHMDEHLLRHLWARDRPRIVTGLGNDIRLASWGIASEARDWGGVVPIRPGIDIILDRAHHWSARSTDDKNRTLWTGFTITLPGGNLYYAGDTGPGDMRWAAEAARIGPVRFAILPIGAIHAGGAISGNHIGPVQAVTAFEQLHAGSALGVHWGTFELTDEPIDLPPTLLRQSLAAEHIAAGRFRTMEAGEQWWIPLLSQDRAPSSSSPIPR